MDEVLRSSGENDKVVTLRMPLSLHRKLTIRAHELSIERGQRYSLNSLCIDALLGLVTEPLLRTTPPTPTETL